MANSAGKPVDNRFCMGMAVGMPVAVLMFMGMFHNSSVFQNMFVEVLIFAFVHAASVFCIFAYPASSVSIYDLAVPYLLNMAYRLYGIIITS